MSKMLIGSICLTEMIDKARNGHSAFVKAANGKVYVNVLLWENDAADKYGNTCSLQLSSLKEKREVEGKVYIGNFKPIEQKQASAADLPNDGWDKNIAQRPTTQQTAESEQPIGGDNSDLPF